MSGFWKVAAAALFCAAYSLFSLLSMSRNETYGTSPAALPVPNPALIRVSNGLHLASERVYTIFISTDGKLAYFGSSFEEYERRMKHLIHMKYPVDDERFLGSDGTVFICRGRNCKTI